MVSVSMHCSLNSFFSPANAEAARLYHENMKEYVRRVKATVEESWVDTEDLNETPENARGSQS